MPNDDVVCHGQDKISFRSKQFECRVPIGSALGIYRGWILILLAKKLVRCKIGIKGHN